MKIIFQKAMVIAFIILLAGKAGSQECTFGKVQMKKQFSLAELESKWAIYLKDPGFKAVADNLAGLGFKRIANNDKFAWGYTGSFTSDTVLGTSPQPVEVCVFDYYKKTATGGQMATVVWRKVSETIYKAYILFPEGVKDVATSMERSLEYYADNTNKIQKADSYGKCWSKCVFKRFNATNCAGAITACAGAAAAAAAAGIGVTTPIALGIFAACAGVFCLYPLAVCLAYCL